jgi:valyl-tRNA synthetase
MTSITINAEAITFRDGRSLANLLRIVGDQRNMTSLTLKVDETNVRMFSFIFSQVDGTILEQLLPPYALPTYQQVIKSIVVYQDTQKRQRESGEAIIRKELDEYMELLDPSYYQQTDEYRQAKDFRSVELEKLHRMLAAAEARCQEIRKDEFAAIAKTEEEARQKIADFVAEYQAKAKQSILTLSFSEFFDAVNDYRDFLKKKKALEVAAQKVQDTASSQREVVMGSDAYMAANQHVSHLRGEIRKVQQAFDTLEKQIKEKFVATAKAIHEQRSTYRNRYMSGLVSSSDTLAVPRKKAHTILTLMIDPSWKP